MLFRSEIQQSDFRNTKKNYFPTEYILINFFPLVSPAQHMRVVRTMLVLSINHEMIYSPVA